MIRATKVSSKNPDTGDATDFIELDFNQRYRRRLAMTSADGTAFLLDLPEAQVLQEGDELVLEDGRKILVRARPEKVAEISADDPQHLLRIAWHLGNRHLPTQILPGRLRILEDHVIVDMVRGLGAKVSLLEAPFQPEGGAYTREHGPSHHDH